MRIIDSAITAMIDSSFNSPINALSYTYLRLVLAGGVVMFSQRLPNYTCEYTEGTPHAQHVLSVCKGVSQTSPL